MDDRIWTDRPLDPGASIDAAGARITRMQTGAQYLISGDLDAAVDALAPGAARLGFAQVADTDDIAIRIARDRALLVTATPVARNGGWQAEGFALSPAGGLYAALALQGEGAEGLVAQMLSAPTPHGSPSAMVHVLGLRVLVTGRTDGLTLWVERGHLAFVTEFLRQAADLS